jgi:protein-tyrosine phosphatase
VHGVVDLSDGSADLGPVVRRQGMRYLRLPVADGRLPEPEELHIVTSWMLQRVYEEGPVLVHEAVGRGNHALVAGAALIKRGASVRRASLQLRNAAAEPMTDAQLDLLVRFAGEMTAARR